MLRWERKRASPSFANAMRWRKTWSPWRRALRRGRQIRHRLLAVGGALGDVAVGGGIARGARSPHRTTGSAPPGIGLREHRVLAVARDAARVAVAPLAVLGAHLLLRLDQLDLEPALLDRDVEDVPGQDLVEVVGAQVRLLRDALGLERLHPEVVAEVLGPAVEAHARLPGRVQDAPDPPVAAREHALDLGLARLVPLHLRAAHARGTRSFRYASLRLERLDAVERRPLERRPGLRHEGADRRR